MFSALPPSVGRSCYCKLQNSKCQISNWSEVEEQGLQGGVEDLVDVFGGEDLVFGVEELAVVYLGEPVTEIDAVM